MKEYYLTTRARDGSVATQVNVNIRTQIARDALVLQRIENDELRIKTLNDQLNRVQFEDEFVTGRLRAKNKFTN